jgi:hypothetical protein
MAGVRSYYSNFLTTTRGPVETSQQFSVVAGGSPTATVVAGRGCAIAPAGNYAGGTGNQFTVTLPEKFGNCVRLNVGVLPVGTTGYAAVITSNYSSVTGKMSFAICTNGAGALTGATSGTFTVYFGASFELGM